MSVIEENWDTQLKASTFEINSYKEFEVKVKYLRQHILYLLEDGFTVSKLNFNGSKVQSNDDELKTLTELNKHLRLDIENKVEVFSKQKVQYENFKKDQKLLSQGIKETHEAFLMAKKLYKKFLKIYYTIESKNDGSQTIFLQFFTEAKKESENYSIRLLRDINIGKYHLISTTPKLHSIKDIQTQLQVTNDLPGALCCIRQAFMHLKKTKK
ncbi:unnamed protein product [Arctia plantaginis]|uniref:Kinetochore protein SPC25 n=1 Tax=Arctia plantaginis TaxID=874455 RepID=A0A8S0ZC32_ARCPL|nr:unnamed protein product [Arctia plantaginis]